MNRKSSHTPEKRKKERSARLAQVQKAVLVALGIAGGLTMALVAPNVLQVFEQFGWVKPRYSKRSTISRSVQRLERAGLVKKDESNFIILTKKGEKRLRKLSACSMNSSTPAKWMGSGESSVSISGKRKRCVNCFSTLQESFRTSASQCGYIRMTVKIFSRQSRHHVGVEILYIIATISRMTAGCGIILI